MQGHHHRHPHPFVALSSSSVSSSSFSSPSSSTASSSVSQSGSTVSPESSDQKPPMPRVSMFPMESQLDQHIYQLPGSAVFAQPGVPVQLLGYSFYPTSSDQSDAAQLDQYSALYGHQEFPSNFNYNQNQYALSMQTSFQSNRTATAISSEKENSRRVYQLGSTSAPSNRQVHFSKNDSPQKLKVAPDGASQNSTDFPKKPRSAKRRVSANRKERRRTQSINGAFSSLRNCIPNVPNDTKLSKIKTLKLATSYISYLRSLLNSDSNESESACAAVIATTDDFSSIVKSTLSSSCPVRSSHSHIKHNTESKGEHKLATGCQRKRRSGWPHVVWSQSGQSKKRSVECI